AVSIRLLEEVAAKPRVLIHLVRHVEIAGFIITFPAICSADLTHEVRHLVVREHFIANGYHLAMTADLRRLLLAKVQVRSARVDENLEKLVDVGHGGRRRKKLRVEG